jgi:carboxyl-terminal processing protease
MKRPAARLAPLLGLLGFGCLGPGGPVAPRPMDMVPGVRAAATHEQPDDSTPPAPRLPLRHGAYDLGSVPVYSKVLFYVRENYYEKRRFQPLTAFLGTLDFVQREVPEVMVEHWAEPRQPWVTVRVNDAVQSFSVRRVDTPWGLRATVGQVLRFIEDHLLPVNPAEESRRLLNIEIAATNGMLFTLDPHSVLLDAESYRAMRVRRMPRGDGATGLVFTATTDGGYAVLRTFPLSPAARAGIEPGDRLLKIDDFPTAQMNIDDLPEHLQGEVGSRLEVTLERRGAKSRRITLVRDRIVSGSLAGPFQVFEGKAAGLEPDTRIGYLHLERFGAGAAQEVSAALWALDRQKISGLVLDLRDNGGGLYAEAVKVADLFLSRGISVAMVAGEQRKEEVNHDDHDEPRVPIAVLVNHASAAAAEILASALRDHDRAAVIGERTFGGGSVQVLFDVPVPDQNEGPLGLRLTTAQWVTPAGRSVQGNGLAPIEIQPELATKRDGAPRIEIEPRRTRREADYEWRLVAAARAAEPEPARVLPFVYVARPEEEPNDPPEWETEVSSFTDGSDRDFALEVAKGLLAGASSMSGREILRTAGSRLDAIQLGEERRLMAALAKLGVDWTPGSRGANADVEVDFKVLGPEPVAAGDVARLRGEVRNLGPTAVHRLRAVLTEGRSSGQLLEVPFGTLPPGATRTADIAFRVPPGTPSMADPFAVRLAADESLRGGSGSVTVAVRGKPRPTFDVGYETTSAGPHGLGLAVRVRNVGPGTSPATTATLRNAAGQSGVLIHAGRGKHENLRPGVSVTFPFTFEPDSARQEDGYRFDLNVGDATFGEAVTHRLSFERGGPGAASGHISAPAVTASAPLVEHGSKVHLSGSAESDGGIRDVFITLQNAELKRLPHKTFYLAVPGSQSRVSFQADVPLDFGSNLIRVTARSADGVSSRFPVVVLKPRR